MTEELGILVSGCSTDRKQGDTELQCCQSKCSAVNCLAFLLCGFQCLLIQWIQGEEEDIFVLGQLYNTRGSGAQAV